MYHQFAHSGQKATLERIKARYFWPTLAKDVSEFVKKCLPCQAVKTQAAIKPPVAKPPVPDTRFSSLQVDIVGPLPPSQGHKYLLSIIDRTSRWVEAIPLTEATAEQCCTAFIHGCVQRFGLPAQLRSDNGKTFVATLWRNVHKAMGIDIAYTLPYHPASLGHIKR